ncbi:putative kinesin [Trypanosoma theileri]|uniref:Putative kinesin n=1 Tax=Trypanosoma theileri TaxID=67003 RepID=A0A1X0P8J2_9TRYP|nr:putative kinesin [Trypanosoma theileri]ORC92750.1 putative kinesin [Trypanosoma theileri]
MLDTSDRQVETEDSVNSPIKTTKMSSSLSRLSLEIPRITTTTSTCMPSSSREERNGLYSVRNRNRNDRTSLLGQSSQDFVHVAIRLKPPVPQSDSSNILQFCIESAPLATPRTGRRGEGTPRCGIPPAVKNSEEESCNGGTISNGSRSLEDSRSASNSNGFHSSTVGIPISSLVQSSPQQISLSPRVGVNGSGKLLTIMFPTADGTKETQRVYAFDEVISPTVTDAEICDAMIPGIIDQLKAGFNACVLCYGQTGSGKTHTINALIPAFIQALFDNLNDPDDIVEVSYIQIHNNNAYNLLGEGKSEHGVLLQKPKGSLVREPRYLVRSAADVQKRITEAQRKRFVGSHLLNTRSSRSHTILSFHVTRCVGGIPVSTNRLTLGDLAGSERVKRTGVAGDELEEAIAINKSLSVLHAVIKATAEDAYVLPVRESILTLYLAASLSGCYLLLIATVSLEKQNCAETKSSLDFATTAKRCVVTKSKGKPRDFLVSGACSFEETYANLMKEIETLRNRVCTLQEEVYIEKQRSAFMQQKGVSDDVNATRDNETMPDRSAEDVKMREHVIALERQCALLQEILRERESELSSLELRGDIAEEERKELEQRAQEREEAQQALEEVAPQLGTSELLHKITDTFLSLQEQFDIMYQEKQVMAKAMEGVRSEQQRTMVDLLEARKELVQAEMKREESRQRMEEAISETKVLRECLEELNLKLLREYVDRAVHEDTVAWFKASGERAEECERLRCDLEEQRNLYDVVQNRLNITESELDRTNKEHGEVLQEMRKKDDAFRTIWLLLTPQQKARFMSIGYSGDGTGDTNSASLHQGHENVQLRSQVRTLRRQLEEELSRNKEREYLIQDLEKKNNLLEGNLQECKEAYDNLLSLDEDSRAERQQMEQQLAHLYNYIEESNVKKCAFEIQLREAHAEWEKLDEQYRHSQREVADLTAQLEKALDEIRTRGTGDDININSHTNSNSHTNTNGSRRPPPPSERRRPQEGTTHSHHSDSSKRRALHRSPELLRKVALQRVDLAKFAHGTAMQSAAHSGRLHRQRRGVSQPLQLLSSSSLSFDGSSRIPLLNSNGIHHTNSSRASRRGRTYSQNNVRDAVVRSVFLRDNSTVAEVPNYIIDKTRRRNS